MVAVPKMTRTAVFYQWNSLCRQYKTESRVGNSLFVERPLKNVEGAAAADFARGQGEVTR
jgi:hypothetical protein